MTDDKGDKANQDYNAQILTLLSEVSARLRKNEVERTAVREILEDIENRVDQSEGAFLSIHDRLSKTESALEKRQNKLEAVYHQQIEKIEKAAAMAERIEAAMLEYESMNQRLDHVVSDGAGMMKKLDKIEGAIAETQKVLKSQALVPNKDDLNDGAFAIWKAPKFSTFQKQMASVAAMLVIGVVGGWSFVKMGAFEMPQSNMRTAEVSVAERAASPFDRVPENRAVALNEAGDVDEMAQRLAAIEPAAGVYDIYDAIDDRSSFYQGDRNENSSQSQSILNLAQSEKEQMFEKNPQALASALNEIEPAAAVVPAVSDTLPEKEASANIRQISASAHEKVTEQTVADFVNAQNSNVPIASLIQPDAALPDIIKEIEAKAFEGVAEAQHDLAAIYTAGHGGVPVDFERAAKWFTESAIQGIANARYNLGVLYHQGLGVPKDITRAVQWYRAAAEKGHPEAEYNLGIAYIEGIGTSYDPAAAAHYFERAAGGGIVEAAYNLGLIHENGIGGAAKPEEALFWYKSAADKGNQEAKTAFDQLVQVMGLGAGDIEKIMSEQAPQKTERSKSDTIRKSEIDDRAQIQPEQVAASSAVIPEVSAPVLADIEPAAQDPREKGYSAATVAQIQEQLIRLGLFPGPPNGHFDPLTEDAIRTYQDEFDLQDDGRPTQALLVHMMTRDLGFESETEVGSRAR